MCIQQIIYLHDEYPNSLHREIYSNTMSVRNSFEAFRSSKLIKLLHTKLQAEIGIIHS